MFEEKEEDKDIRTEYLEWLRKFREQNPEAFNNIRKMPLKVSQKNIYKFLLPLRKRAMQNGSRRFCQEKDCLLVRR